MDTESQLLADKDAEIERLELKLANTRDDSQDKDAEIARLKKWNLMTDEQVVMDLKAEIEQLKAILDNEHAEMRIKNVLITELADALELPFEEWIDQSDLVQRAREATR